MNSFEIYRCIFDVIMGSSLGMYVYKIKHNVYRSGTVNSKSFVGKVLLRIKWKFELTVYFKHEILGQL